MAVCGPGNRQGGARSQPKKVSRLGLHRRGSLNRVRPSSPDLSGIGRAPVAQLDRASDYESEGWRFDSFRARHFSLSAINIKRASD